MPGIVPLESRLGLRFHEPAETPRWSVELAARIVDAQRRIAASLLEVPSAGFTVWDVRGYWRATDHLLVLAGIENFTDKNYREHLNFTSQNGLVQVFQPGLNGYLGPAWSTEVGGVQNLAPISKFSATRLFSVGLPIILRVGNPDSSTGAGVLNRA